MARLYLPFFGTNGFFYGSGEPVPMKPAIDAAWYTGPGWRARWSMEKNRTGMGTTAYEEDISDDSDRNICFAQFIGDILAVGVQFGGGFYDAQCRVSQIATTQHMALACGIRVIAADAVTVRSTLLAVTRISLEAAAGTLTNRIIGPAVGGWTPTVYGDRPVLEIGMGGDPNLGSGHNCGMRFGDSGGADLPIDNTSISDYNPWFMDGVNPASFMPNVTIRGNTTIYGGTTLQ